MSIHLYWRSLCAAVVLSCAANGAAAQNAVSAGELYVEPATLIALGFEWTIEGDDNRNARVALDYRRPGE
ncbi:MAG: hypothetical protein RL026_938, partial [Pseudomonadota bacterium]